MDISHRAHPDAAIGYSGIATVQSQALQLGTGAEMPQLTFETIGPTWQAERYLRRWSDHRLQSRQMFFTLI